MKLKILQVIPSLSPEHGGPSESVLRLSLGLQSHGLAETHIWATDSDTSIKFMDHCHRQFANVQFFKAHRFPVREFSLALVQQLRARVRNFDLVHIHSVFNFSSLAAAAVCTSRQVPYVISPRGMLQPWSLRQKAWSKKMYRLALLDRQIRRARGVHVTSELEMESFQKEFPGIPVACIPNPLPNVGAAGQPLREQFPELQGKRVMLYLSRIHRKKGVSELLEAWRIVSDDFPDWHLVLVGPGERRSVSQMQASITRLRLHQRVSWVGPLFDGERDEAYRSAQLFIQPSFQENFGNSIAEAMAAGCPVITTRETPWKILEDNRWGWWVPMSVESLAGAMREALKCAPEELQARGAAARAWIEGECSIESVARIMAEWYRKILPQT